MTNDELSYSRHDEILAYFQGSAKKYGLYKYISLNHYVTGAVWNEEKGIWNIEIKDLENDKVINDWGHIFINGCGILKYVSPITLTFNSL
jgi:cation diffusion facilitator CzcD-associated flavoprotein CzcO